MNNAPTGESSPARQVYSLLTDLFLVLDDADRQFFGEYGLSTRQFWALHHLCLDANLSMTELSRLLFTDKSNATAIGDQLEKAGLARRGPAPRDRRRILLSITPEGRARHDEVLAAHHRRIEALLGTDQIDLPATVAVLTKLHQHINEQLHLDRTSLIVAQPSETASE